MKTKQGRKVFTKEELRRLEESKKVWGWYEKSREYR